MQARYVLLISVVSFCIGAAVCFKFLPPSEVTRDKVVTVIKETVRPDGSKETDTTITQDTKKVAPILVQKPNWLISGSIGTSLQLVPIYGVLVQYRLIGPVYIGAQGTTAGYAGLTLGMEF